MRVLRHRCSQANHGAPLVVRHARAARCAPHSSLPRLLVGVFALYVVYELGRYNAGYDRQAVAQQRTELEVQIEQLEKANREMRTQLAELDTIRIGRAHEQAEVARAIGDLQAQVARQSQELAFYRGVVAQGAVPLGVKIQQLHITPAPARRPSSCTCRWCAPGARTADASAPSHLSLDGSTDGAARIARSRRAHRRAGARAALQLPLPREPRPGDHRAARLQARAAGRRSAVEPASELAPLSQTFLWTRRGRSLTRIPPPHFGADSMFTRDSRRTADRYADRQGRARAGGCRVRGRTAPRRPHRGQRAGVRSGEARTRPCR